MLTCGPLSCGTTPSEKLNRQGAKNAKVLGTRERKCENSSGQTSHKDMSAFNFALLPWRSFLANFASWRLTHVTCHSFTDPNVSPETKYLLNNKNTITTGRLTKIEAAA